MRWKEITEAEDNRPWFTIEQVYRTFPEAAASKDLEKAIKWHFGVGPDEVEFTFGTTPITNFKRAIDDLTVGSGVYPKDRARIKNIFREISDGGRALPVFIEDGTFDIVWGRHRVVALHQHGMQKIIVGNIRVVD